MPALENYRLGLAVSRQSAETVELQFALAPELAGEASRYVLRLTTNEVQIGQRPADRGAFTELSPPVPAPADDPADGPVYHELRVERHATHWRVFFDGNRIALLPLPRGPELPEFRLVTEGGQAWFDAVQATELVAPSGTS